MSISFDNTVLNHPLLLSPGLNIRYNRTLLQQKVQSISVLGSFGLISTPQTDNRLVFGLGGEYAVHFLKRFSIATGIQANYVLTALKYDVFEYNSEGNWENRGNLLHNFSPGMHLSLQGDFVQRDLFKMGAFLELRMLRLNESYEKKWLQGYVPIFSIGIKSNF
ncbi:hypothetical protein [Algoriphagus sp.]|uniref:hypothetical protein n=1 Tax=Algoriphagus sp. TaxID=1872435 RepID=UPI00391B55F4